MPISTSLFYKKRNKLIPCVPSNNIDSDGSSSDGEVDEVLNKSCKVSRSGILIPAKDDEVYDSDNSLRRHPWPNPRKSSAVCIPETDSSERDSSSNGRSITPISDISSPCGTLLTSPDSFELKKTAHNEKKEKKNHPQKKKKGIIITDRFASNAQKTSVPPRPARRRLFVAPPKAIKRKLERYKSQNIGPSCHTQKLFQALHEKVSNQQQYQSTNILRSSIHNRQPITGFEENKLEGNATLRKKMIIKGKENLNAGRNSPSKQLNATPIHQKPRTASCPTASSPIDPDCSNVISSPELSLIKHNENSPSNKLSSLCHLQITPVNCISEKKNIVNHEEINNLGNFDNSSESDEEWHDADGSQMTLECNKFFEEVLKSSALNSADEFVGCHQEAIPTSEGASNLHFSDSSSSNCILPKRSKISSSQDTLRKYSSEAKAFPKDSTKENFQQNGTPHRLHDKSSISSRDPSPPLTSSETTDRRCTNDQAALTALCPGLISQRPQPENTKKHRVEGWSPIPTSISTFSPEPELQSEENQDGEADLQVNGNWEAKVHNSNEDSLAAASSSSLSDFSPLDKVVTPPTLSTTKTTLRKDSMDSRAMCDYSIKKRPQQHNRKSSHSQSDVTVDVTRFTRENIALKVNPRKAPANPKPKYCFRSQTHISTNLGASKTGKSSICSKHPSLRSTSSNIIGRQCRNEKGPLTVPCPGSDSAGVEPKDTEPHTVDKNKATPATTLPPSQPLPEPEYSSGSSVEQTGWRIGDLQAANFDNRPAIEAPDSIMSPVEYFRYFFDERLLGLIVEQTNLYCVQENRSLHVSPHDIESFFGILIYMGVCTLPSVVDYWAQHTRVPQIAETMSRTKFQKIRSSIHFADNTERSSDRLKKVRPLLDYLRLRCRSLDYEFDLCVDECMVPYKGTFAGNLRQYMPDKPSSKWGFKLFVLAGISGITYDFIPYCGADTFINENLSDYEISLGVGAKAVIALSKNIDEDNRVHTCITFDNYYTGIPLVTYLKREMRLLSLGTIKRNRTQHCPLTPDKAFLKSRGACESFINDDGVVVVHWADNKAVCLASTAAGVEPKGHVRRYDKNLGCKGDVECPQSVLMYNKTMGGVDLGDQFMALYRIPMRAKRWYMPLLGFALGVALNNSWLLYKRHCQLLGAKQDVQSSKDFRLHVSRSLCAAPQRAKGRPTLNSSLERKKIHRPIVPRPCDDVRSDGLNHWPEWCKKGRCRYCAKGYSRHKCTKCDVVLCLTEDRNCFVQFHL